MKWLTVWIFLFIVIIVIKIAINNDKESVLKSQECPNLESRLASEIAEARVEGVKSDIRLSEIEVENADKNYDRCKKLRLTNNISEEQYGAAVQRNENAKANHIRNQFRLKEAEGLAKLAKLTGIVDKVLTSK